MSTIITRNSATSGSIPSSLVQGELAINVTDGRLFYGSGSGNIVKEFTVSGSGGGTTNTGSLLTTASFSNPNLTFTKGNGSTFNVNLVSLVPTSASYALTASFITASGVYGPYGSNSVISASYAATSSLSERTTQIDVYVLNQSGANIAKGVVVRITGSNNSSDIPRIVTASYTNDNNSANTLGITTTAIANGAEGYVITEGILKGIDTQAFISGQLVYLGATGSIIGTAPLAPLHTVRLGEVIRHQSNNGSIYVRIDNGYELGELHDVLDTSTTSSYGDLLVKSGSIWINSKQLTGSYGLTGSLTATSFTGSLQGTSSWANNAVTASYVLQAVSASFASTASFVQNAQTASYVLNAVSASFATTASFVTSASFASTAQTANTASYVLNAVSASFASTASFVRNAQTASYVLNAVSASFATTASFVTSASFATTASFVRNAQTASYVLNAVSASFATTASYALNALNAENASYSTNALSSSYALNSSYATTASFALNAPQSTYYAAKLTQTYSGGTITSGLLVVGESYEITTYNGGDDFSNVAEVTYGVINTTGCVFKATGTKPTTYTNNSTLTPLGYPVVENFSSMNTLANGTIPYWRRLAAGTFHFNFTSSIDHVKVAPKFQADSTNNYKTRAIVNQSDNANYSFLDSRFATAANAAGGFNDVIRAIDYQSDGKIIVGGLFTNFNGSTVNYICRLNPDGTEDTTFTTNIGTGFNAEVRTIKVQPYDDKILVGGIFTSFNGTTVNYICRLNSNGTEDTSFTTNIGTGFNDKVCSIKLISDSSIIAGGKFTDFNGNTVGRITKLDLYGNYDSTFTSNTGTGFNNDINSIDIDSSDNIYAGGAFTDFNGTTVNYAAKMNSTGVQDYLFSTNISTNLNNTVYAIRYNSNKVLIGGDFTSAFGSVLNYICQINPDGTQDVNFTSVATDYGAGTGYNLTVFAIEAVADGWLVGGNFTAFNSSSPNYFNYIQNTGKQLNGYRAFGTSFDSTVYSLKLYPGNKILIGGAFISYDGVANKCLANLYYTYDVVLIVDGDGGVNDGYLNKSSIEVTLYN